ncbi:MAG TPA: hypothetical protein VFO16_01570 [Pseudonocardiaceae bacterium]|nr:hypothetical protein [Pseudonocardiaceae bacterium]
MMRVWILVAGLLVAQPQPPATPPPPDRLPSPAAPRVGTQPPTPAQPPTAQPTPERPTPRQGVPTNQAVATVTMFWQQPAPTLATISSAYLYAYYIDTATTGVAITATCVDTTGQQGLFNCSGPMTSLVSGTHTYTLEVQCATCGDPKNVRTGAVSYTYSGSSTVQAPASITIESGSGAIIPPSTIIVDSIGATWTQSATVPASCPPSVTGHPASDCLNQMRNGTVIGLGSQVYYKNRNVYVYGPSGTTNHWWQYLNNQGCPGGSTSNCWTDVGTAKP